MTNTNTIPPAIARLLALGPLPSQMSARAAADVLGGAHRLEYVLHLVEVGDLASWTHSPTHGDQWHWKDRHGSEKILPRIAPDTDPDAVRVSGEDVLWHWCVLFEEAIHGGLPPKDAVEQRLAQVRSLQREYALGTLAAPTEDAPAAPCASPAPPDDPARRLARLRELGGSVKRRSNGEWGFTKITRLAAEEKAQGRNRSDEKTIRLDLKEAAQNEFEARRAGFCDGLGQR